MPTAGPGRDDEPLMEDGTAVVPLTLADHAPTAGEPRQLVPGRECGSCVVCCDVLGVDEPELRKPAHELCRHNTGSSCTIYATRPGVCRTFYCLWRRMPELGDECRPDRLGLLLTVDSHPAPQSPFERVFVAARALNSADDFETPAAAAALNMIVRDGTLPLWLSFKGRKSLAYPAKPLVEAIENPWGTIFSHLIPPALAWRKRLGMD